ncbi:RTA1 like protein-domain-containing protein [Aspergillus alliaceus]|uniref:RTA1 like protein-domain-containing protein n=1 Tax=Petromyces alliaceus TaxID=209559 RepID=A0A5N7CM43_PETAA|nr:RTA1 like protein-domain-containing protein [Aspergillus alliaceus]KAB8233419.1 RTA1 like protein-domain-containing protein [Aspergillus alliaceus]KAE8395165.1 RTA1 like protein-domain-containing protein [Aspergillus alliaceus]
MGKSIYFYDPSLAASILFTVLYVLPFAYHLYMSTIAPYTGKYHRIGYFIPMVVGAATEVGAYAVRAASVKKQDDVGLYATSSSLIVIAPVLVCASLYILIGRLIQSGGRTPNPDSETKEPLLLFGKFSPSWIPRIFVTSDVISFLTQAAGSGIASSNNWQGSQKDAGVGILIAGLVLQLVTFAFFLVVVIWFDLRSPASSRGGDVESGVRLVLNGIYVAGFFITVGIKSFVIGHLWLLETLTGNWISGPIDLSSDRILHGYGYLYLDP